MFGNTGNHHFRHMPTQAELAEAQEALNRRTAQHVQDAKAMARGRGR